MILRIGRKFWHFSQRYREPYKTQWVLDSLKKVPGNTKGEVQIGKWLVEYVDASALQSMWSLQFVRRYNDFYTTKENPRILDCGSNVGVSVLRYKELYPRSRITAFEPDPVICRVLRENISRNSLTEVEIVEAAVWTEQTNKCFVSFAKHDSQSGHLTEDLDVVGHMTAIPVPTIWLGDYLCEPVDFLKLDVEGAELPVLESCHDRLSVVDQMMIEVHYMVDQPHSLIRILEILKDNNFKIALYQVFGPPTFVRFRRNEKAVADQFPVLWAWKT